MDLNDLLFIKGPDNHGSPLFESQADLVRVIMRIPDGDFQGRNEKSVRAFVNQALRPVKAKNSRPISPNLRKALFAAIRKKLNEDPDCDAEAVLKQVPLALAELKGGKSQTELGDEFKDLMSVAAKATTHYILTPRPFEDIVSDKADKLINLMLRRLRLVEDEKAHEENDSKEVHYIFNVKSESVAIQFWKKLSAYLRDEKKMEESEIDQKLQKINSENRTTHSLRIYSIEAIYCVHPDVVFDPERADRTEDYEQGREGFTVYYHPNNQVSISKMSPERLQEWYDLFYLRLENKPKVFQREEIRWKTAYLHNALN